ncbi:MAG: nucleotidyl transferase AbiEii/AbiGii toxin family protein [Sphaerochaetaceae bacterium]|nr:nucleotidyl transferase AbiEii/AbiGii toxin family protein [Sphaerochaetaceae bacterium]
MITSNPMQLKSRIKNLVAKKNLPAQIIMQNYLMERLLERLSLSSYRENFIIKGGFLIAIMVGLGARSTMDLDATIKGFKLKHESIRDVFEHICTIGVDDVTFSVNRTIDIRETDDYPGIRVSLTASYPPLQVPLSVDVTTGDKITPREIKYSFPLLFDDRSISMMAYNLETILAEKLETILSRNIANTRPRDFYDMYILYSLRWDACSVPLLRTALERTATKRGSLSMLPEYESIVTAL